MSPLLRRLLLDHRPNLVPDPDRLAQWKRFVAANLMSHGPIDEKPSLAPNRDTFLRANFTNKAGSRPFKLFIPNCYTGQPTPLIVMLHGCTQSADDFALGTGMNKAAEQNNFLVLYPEQVLTASAQMCWNWFKPSDQLRGYGEPSLIAGMVAHVESEYCVDKRRIYVAGLSAGGAAAAVLGEEYNDIFAAVGIHSGIACGAAHDLPSAMEAMRIGRSLSSPTATKQFRPTIIFHGDRDNIVNVCNAELAAERASAAAIGKSRSDEFTGGRHCTKVVHSDGAGRVVTERWTIHGAGHAWSGGNPAGSYSDASGPDATKEMMRFFKEQTLPA